MVRQTQGGILDEVMGTDIDLNKILLPGRQPFRPMDEYTDDIDFLQADEFTSADELEVGNMITIGEETTQSFYGEESQECLSTAESPDYLNSAQSPGYLNSAESLLSGDSTCSSTIFTFPPTDSCQDTTELVLQDACLEDLDFPITPLIKEEVKMKIKLRRMAEGKEELRVEFKAPEPERLTQEEEDRRTERRHKNKLAAQKCRSKKRKLAETLEGETEKLENKQDLLIQEIERLQQEKEHLESIVKIHSSFCPKMRSIMLS